MLHKAWNSKEEMPYCFPRLSIKFQGHTGQNITDFDPNWAFPDYRPVAAFKSFRFALFQHYFRLWLGACRAPSHYLNQCWPRPNANWSFANKFQWISIKAVIFFQGNSFENVVCKMSAILFCCQYVGSSCGNQVNFIWLGQYTWILL